MNKEEYVELHRLLAILKYEKMTLVCNSYNDNDFYLKLMDEIKNIDNIIITIPFTQPTILDINK